MKNNKTLQLIEQRVFHQLKIVDDKGGLHPEAAKQYIKDTIKEPMWQSIMDKAFDRCAKEAPKYTEYNQKLANFPKEECDMTFDYISDCINVASFGVSS
jgi:hypothetical protein